MAAHAGVHVAWMSPFVCLCHANHNSQSSVFSFLYKNVSACYIHYWKKEEMQNACLCANLKNTVDLWHIYMAYSHMAYIHMGGTTWTKGQFPREALTSLHLS